MPIYALRGGVRPARLRLRAARIPLRSAPGVGRAVRLAPRELHARAGRSGGGAVQGGPDAAGRAPRPPVRGLLRRSPAVGPPRPAGGVRVPVGAGRHRRGQPGHRGLPHGLDRAPPARGAETIASRLASLGRPLGLAVLLAGALLHARAGYFQDDLSGHARGSDDAYISYRYAQNLARGHGLVFTPGDRVEGYSNLLYVLLLTPFCRVAGPEAIYPISVALNLLFAAGAWALFSRLAARRRDPLRAGLASLLFGLCPALWLWTASGMETPLFLLLQIAVWVLVDQAAHGESVRPAWLAAVVFLSVLARADGFVVPTLAVLYLLAIGRKREALAAGAALGVTLAALIGGRLAYYGYPLP